MKFIVGSIVGAFINVVFWVLYTATGNVISSIAITAGVSIGVISILYKLGQRQKS